MINTYKLKLCENGDWYVENLSPMFPTVFKNKIDKLAGEQITSYAEPIGGFFGSFVNTFVIKADKINIFKNKVIPFIGFSSDSGGSLIWDNSELLEANLI